MARVFGPCGEIILEGTSGFVSRESSGEKVVSTGASGDIIVLTPPAGQRVKLTKLICTTGPETGITITVGLTTVVNSLDLEDNTATSFAANEFIVGTSSGSAISPIPEILGKTNEVVTITKDTGSTSSNINYAYEYGE